MTTGDHPRNASPRWVPLDHHRPAATGTRCPICRLRGDEPLTGDDAQTAQRFAQRLGDTFEIRECLRIPGRFHLIAGEAS